MTNCLRPLTDFTVFNGRSIRNARRPDKPLIFFPLIVRSRMNEIQPTKTTKKSKMFQESFIYANSVVMKPNVIIFNIASSV